VIGFLKFWDLLEITNVASPICMNNGDEMTSSCTMVINTIGQLAGGITFAYELGLTLFLHHWKYIDV
jgi:hypothetical protein